MKGIVAGSRIAYEPPTGRELLGSVELGGGGGKRRGAEAVQHPSAIQA